MEKHVSISTAILGGGKSTRMGKNKAFLNYNGKPFVRQIKDELEKLEKDGISKETIISAAEAGEYENIGITTVIDEHENIGPIEGIYQVLKKISTEYVFICAVDMPFIRKELVEYMAGYICSDYDCYVVRDDERIQPLCAIYSKKLLPVIEKQISGGEYRLAEVLNIAGTKYIDLEYTCFSKDIVKNINTPQEYEQIITNVMFCVSGVKNSGKTSLIVKLIGKFKEEGYRVGVIKHDGHDFLIDHEGTDTFKYTQAGAVISSIFSLTKYCINGNESVDEMFMIDSLSGVDVIILEGFKYSEYPKIEVVRSVISDKGVCDESTLICVASDMELNEYSKCPVCDIDDVDQIYRTVKDYFKI